MSNRISAVFLVTALAISSALHAQAQQAAGGGATLNYETVRASIRPQIRALADSARVAGLPEAPIVNKAQQGSGYASASDAQIIAAARTVLQDMRTVRIALGSSATAADVGAGVDALRAGVDSVTLRKLGATRTNAALFVSLSVIADLVESRVPVDTAVQVVTRLMVAGVRGDDMAEYRDAVRTDINTRSMLPAAAASFRAGTTVLKGTGELNSAAGPGPRNPGRPPIPPEQN